jgi:beta-glucosidase
MDMNIEKMISEMTLREKCTLLVGLDSWHTYSIPRLNVPSIMMADGPHGLRKQLQSNNDVQANESYKAVCFPNEVTVACSFDPQVAYQMGKGIAMECLNKDVQVLLGPGLNIKRSPLCGRNFEYYSEDPVLTGEMGAGFVRGIQSKNVGACIKHYALNSQESYRMISNSVADERAFYEIYTKAFRRAVQENPAMVMCSYNKIDGIYASENRRVLNDVLRQEFGFQNVIVSDWTATNERDSALKASLDLEMPGHKYSIRRLEKAFKKGIISMEEIDASVGRILQLVATKINNRIEDFDLALNHELAKKITAESLVLLKNDNHVLPLLGSEKIAIIGQMAKKVRYQGGGSSHINPFKVISMLDCLPLETNYVYGDGYRLDGDGYDFQLIEAAKTLAIGKDKVILVIGLTDLYESEGYDRNHLDLPKGHTELVKAVLQVNPNVIVVLQIGSPILMPWLSDVKAVLNTYLVGEAGSSAVVDVLYGKTNPSGRLAESFPARLEDTPCYHDYALGNGDACYKESIYVGYRYYSSIGLKTLFPFGYGISYTTFEYRDLTLSTSKMKVPGKINVSVYVKNTGQVPGKEVVMLFIKPDQSHQFKPKHELRKFTKIMLSPGEEQLVSFELTDADFNYYEPAIHGFSTDSGIYQIQIRKDAETLLLESEVTIVAKDAKKYANSFLSASSYRIENRLAFSNEDFESLIGRKPKAPHIKRLPPLDINCNLEDLSFTKFGAFVARKIIALGTAHVKDAEEPYQKMVEKSLKETPLRSIAIWSGGMISINTMKAIVEICNGRIFRAIGYLFRRS